MADRADMADMADRADMAVWADTAYRADRAGKSEIMNGPLAQWQHQLLGDAIASKKDDPTKKLQYNFLDWIWSPSPHLDIVQKNIRFGIWRPLNIIPTWWWWWWQCWRCSGGFIQVGGGSERRRWGAAAAAGFWSPPPPPVGHLSPTCKLAPTATCFITCNNQLSYFIFSFLFRSLSSIYPINTNTIPPPATVPTVIEEWKNWSPTPSVLSLKVVSKYIPWTF